METRGNYAERDEFPRESSQSPKQAAKWWTDEDVKQYGPTNARQRSIAMENKYRKVVQKPDEVLKANDVHYRERECVVYLKDVERKDGVVEKLALIAQDDNNANALLGSPVNQKEYENLKEGIIDLTDLRRDPQTRVMNTKGVQEAAFLEKLKADGMLDEYSVIWRPFNVSESNADIVGILSPEKVIEDLQANETRPLPEDIIKNPPSVKHDLEMKGTYNDSNADPMSTQVKNINEYIHEKITNGAFDKGTYKIFCDTECLNGKGGLQKVRQEEILQGIEPQYLKDITMYTGA